ncbi:hypothetical protein BC940DRAFT_296988 [Gongronella butleri]|nr:hypothetical protein BC940DRAFT_296988 [Gongronella butleri]
MNEGMSHSVDHGEAEPVDVEDFVFKSLVADAKVALQGQSFNKEYFPSTVSLLACAPTAGYFAAAHNQGFVYGTTKALRAAFYSAQQGDVQQLSERILVPIHGAQVHQVRLTADEAAILLGLSDGTLQAYRVADIVEKKEHATPFSSVNLTPILDLRPNPVDNDVACVLFRDGSCRLLRWATGDVIAALPGAFSAICWSPKGKQVVCGRADGSLEFYDLSGAKKDELAIPTAMSAGHGEEDTNRLVQDVLWIESHVFLVLYSRPVSDPLAEDATFVHTGYIIDRKPAQGGNGPLYTPLAELTPIFSSEGSTSHFYMELLRQYGNAQHIVMIANAATNELSVVGQDAQGQWATWMLPEGSNITLPLNEETYLDTMPVGLALDLGADEPLPAFDPAENDTPVKPMPVIYYLNDEGHMGAFHCYSNSLAQSGAQYQGMASAAPATTPAASMAASAIPATTLSSAPATQLTASTPSAFGASGFGALAQQSTQAPAFGATSGFGSSSGFGALAQPSSTSTGGFGASGFGALASQSSTTSTTTDGFGASGFASLGTAGATPSTGGGMSFASLSKVAGAKNPTFAGFGQTSPGAASAATSTPSPLSTTTATAAPAFGATTSFGSMAPTAASTAAPTFGAFAQAKIASATPTFGATTSFGAASTEKSAFGATSTEKPAFGSTTTGFGALAKATPSGGSTAPAFGATTGFGAAAAATATPAFGATTSFGAAAKTDASSKTPFGATSFGKPSTTSVPAFGAAAPAPAHAETTPPAAVAPPADKPSPTDSTSSFEIIHKKDVSSKSEETPAPSFGNLTLNVCKPSEPAAKPAPTSLFGNLSKPATTQDTSATPVPAKSLFGGTTTTTTATPAAKSLFGATPAPATAPATVPTLTTAATTPASTKPPTFTFGSTTTATTTTPKAAPTLTAPLASSSLLDTTKKSNLAPTTAPSAVPTTTNKENVPPPALPKSTVPSTLSTDLTSMYKPESSPLPTESKEGMAKEFESIYLRITAELKKLSAAHATLEKQIDGQQKQLGVIGTSLEQLIDNVQMLTLGDVVSVGAISDKASALIKDCKVDDNHAAINDLQTKMLALMSKKQNIETFVAAKQRELQQVAEAEARARAESERLRILAEERVRAVNLAKAQARRDRALAKEAARVAKVEARAARAEAKRQKEQEREQRREERREARRVKREEAAKKKQEALAEAAAQKEEKEDEKDDKNVDDAPKDDANDANEQEPKESASDETDAVVVEQPYELNDDDEDDLSSISSVSVVDEDEAQEDDEDEDNDDEDNVDDALDSEDEVLNPDEWHVEPDYQFVDFVTPLPEHELDVNIQGDCAILVKKCDANGEILDELEYRINANQQEISRKERYTHAEVRPSYYSLNGTVRDLERELQGKLAELQKLERALAELRFQERERKARVNPSRICFDLEDDDDDDLPTVSMGHRQPPTTPLFDRAAQLDDTFRRLQADDNTNRVLDWVSKRAPTSVTINVHTP